MQYVTICSDIRFSARIGKQIRNRCHQWRWRHKIENDDVTQIKKAINNIHILLQKRNQDWCLQAETQCIYIYIYVYIYIYIPNLFRFILLGTCPFLIVKCRLQTIVVTDASHITKNDFALVESSVHHLEQRVVASVVVDFPITIFFISAADTKVTQTYATSKYGNYELTYI